MAALGYGRARNRGGRGCPSTQPHAVGVDIGKSRSEARNTHSAAARALSLGGSYMLLDLCPDRIITNSAGIAAPRSSTHATTFRTNHRPVCDASVSQPRAYGQRRRHSAF
jgi:hypothetical protein